MAVSQFGTRISRLAKKHPASAKDIELWAYANLGLRVGHESIRKALNGDIDPAQCAVELLMALAGFYGVDPSELGHHAEARLQAVLAFAGRKGPDTPNGQELSRRACDGGRLLDFRARGTSVPSPARIAA